MATKNNETSKLVLKVETGVAANGSAVYSQRSFSNINPALADDDMFAIGKGLADLQESPLGEIVRQNTAVISE